ncbi:MAG: hypothetical protein O9341_13795 [Paucibacter sp.]|nr:hypothetical protein [Roseateles sp.]
MGRLKDKHVLPPSNLAARTIQAWVQWLVWWVCLALSLTLPFWLLSLVTSLGGHFADTMDVSTLQDLSSAAFVASTGLSIWLLCQPERYLPARFTLGYLLIIAWAIAAFAARSTCGGTIPLGKLGAPVVEQSQYECDA